MSEEITEVKVSINGEVIAQEVRGDYVAYIVSDKTGEYETILKFDFKADKLQKMPQKGDKVYMSGFAGAREWKGKYYVGVRGAFSKILSGSSPAPVKSESPSSSEEDGDDVPF